MSLTNHKILFFLLAIIWCAVFVPGTPAQFSLSKQTHAIFSGQLVDVNSGAPISAATVTIRTEYGDEQAKTDNAGNFLLEVNDNKGLKNFLIIFSHPDYREKDLSTLFKSTFDSKTRLSLQGDSKNSTATIKYKKESLSLNCGSDGKIATKDGRLLNFQVECLSDSHGLGFSVSRGNTFLVTGSGDISIEIDGEKAKIELARDETVRIEIKGLMYKR